MMEKIAKIYLENMDWFNLKKSQLKKKLIILSVLRFLLFILLIVSLVFLIQSFTFFKLSLGMVSLILFISSISHYIRLSNKLAHYKYLIKINLNELDALNHNYSVFYDGSNYLNRDHSYSYDLDLFGDGSFFQYINRTVTLLGRDLLASRLLKIDFDSLQKKQHAIQELAENIDWRQNLSATAYSCPVSDDDNKKIDFWVNEPVYFIKRKFYKFLVIALPIITLMFLALAIVGLFQFSWFVLFALIQLFIAGILFRRSNKEQQMLTEEIRILKNYAQLISLIEKKKFSSDLLQSQQMKLRTGSIYAEKAFNKLIRIIDAFDTRLNIIVGPILHATLMWDLNCLIRLENWKVKYGKNIHNWLEVIAEFDFYCSLSNYCFNNPHYTFPELNNDLILDVKEMGHPLIPVNKRITNDYSLLRSGQIDIVTGANMAGKSTFLRTIGINLIAAMNGMPVCAKEFKFQKVELFSGMRTADSLKENESYFYAELKRLKQIVDALKLGKKTFILLDEILKGTNSIDKAEGSWKFVEHLIKLNATGIVATHDLTLCALDKKYPDNIKNKCFEVEIEKDKIRFDYKLRNGVTQNMNASILMHQMGIFSNE